MAVIGQFRVPGRATFFGGWPERLRRTARKLRTRRARRAPPWMVRRAIESLIDFIVDEAVDDVQEKAKLYDLYVLAERVRVKDAFGLVAERAKRRRDELEIVKPHDLDDDELDEESERAYAAEDHED